jgi:hypothetical protein
MSIIIAVTAMMAIRVLRSVAQTVRTGGSRERAAFQSIPSFGNNMIMWFLMTAMN